MRTRWDGDGGEQVASQHFFWGKLTDCFATDERTIVTSDGKCRVDLLVDLLKTPVASLRGMHACPPSSVHYCGKSEKRGIGKGTKEKDKWGIGECYVKLTNQRGSAAVELRGHPGHILSGQCVTAQCPVPPPLWPMRQVESWQHQCREAEA